jgi:ribonuclease P protein component
LKTAASKPTFSFSRKYRLTTKADFSAVFDDQLKVSLGSFLALYIKNQKAYPRLGLIVSKRIIRKAAARNHLKRVLREGFRVRKESIPAIDLVIMARKGCKIENKVKLQKELDTLWQRLMSLQDAS